MERKKLNPVTYIVRQLFAFKGFTAQSFVLIMLMAIVNLPLPLMQKIIIDNVIPSGEVVNIIIIGILAFFTRGIASGFQVIQNYVVRQVMASIAHRLRMQMTHAMLNTKYPLYIDGTIANYVGRLSSDVSKMELMIYDTFRFVLRPLGMISVMVTVMCMISIPATILILIVSPASVFLTRKMARQLRHLEEFVLEKREKLQKNVSEVLDNIRVIRCFNKEHQYQEHIRGTIREYTDMSVKHVTKKAMMQNIIDLITKIPWMVMVVGGSIMINNSELTLGDFMAFIAFEQLLHSPVAQLCFYLLNLKSGMVGPERIEEVIDIEPEQAETGTIPKNNDGKIELKSVEFTYPNGASVLHGLTETVAPGERIAVVGVSGAGKTTLINLLLGFYHCNGGDIAIDGISQSETDLRSLRKQIGVVFQDNPMFDATIRENILLGLENISEEQIWEALEMADCAPFVKSLPDGLETLVGVKGLKLSGGQRQRLAIARVILRNPSIILMDEATSSLDSVSEFQIKGAMNRMLAGRTSITIAHRLSTIVESDRIFYLEKGVVVESGSHQKLLEKQGRYFELYKTQTDGLFLA